MALLALAQPHKGPKTSRGLPTPLMGYAIECLVEAYMLVTAHGRLMSARPDSDVDHRDFIISERGRYLSVYLQIKGKTKLTLGGSGGHYFQASVQFPSGKVLSDPRLIYVFCLLDAPSMTLVRCWVVPAPDFSRLASRVSTPKGRVQLLFNAGRKSKWSRYEIAPTQLGPRILELIRAAHRVSNRKAA